MYTRRTITEFEEAVIRFGEKCRSHLDNEPVLVAQEVVKMLGGSFERLNDSPSDATIKALTPEEGKFLITIYCSKERTEEVLAKQIGHLLTSMGYMDEETWVKWIGKTRVDTVRGNDLYAVQDKRARLFAYGLLLDKRKLERTIRENAEDDDTIDVDDLAKRFNLSKRFVKEYSRLCGFLN